MRAAACANFGYLDLKLDSEKNAHSPQDHDIFSRDSTVRVLVVRAQEDCAIAKECWRLVSAKLGGFSRAS
jgi:acetate kinase